MFINIILYDVGILWYGLKNSIFYFPIINSSVYFKQMVYNSNTLCFVSNIITLYEK